MPRSTGSSRADGVPDNQPSVIHIGAGTVRLRVRGSGGDPHPAGPVREVSTYGKWRALSLLLVYVLMVVHIVHWKLNGTTLAPLELNEVMYTLELGIVTAGFLLMAFLFVATLVFGRFFCSWACHILALQDLCSWLLEKVGIRPKPVRARLLLLVPPIALLYMFGWPQLVRIMEGRPAPQFRIFSDEEGWASFLTNDFWRNLPDPWITALTFAICGFVIVYFLGSRSFCQYACPYGAVFSFFDRAAPGRIKLTGDCAQCGHCTAVCTSHVRVHEEIAAHGMVVDANCMKDLDCVSTCPQKAITYGFTKPAFLSSFSRTGRRRLRYDFSLVEEAIMGVVFLATLFVFRGLYNAVPFLLTLGLGGILAYLAVLGVRLVRLPHVRFNQFQLKRSGLLTNAGWVFVLLAGVLGAFCVHSAFIRFHEHQGHRAYLAAEATSPPDAPQVATALFHLTKVERAGLFHPLLLDQRLADLHLMNGSPSAAEPYLRAVLARRPEDLSARMGLARVELALGRPRAAEIEARRTLADAHAVEPWTRADRDHLLHTRVDAHRMLAEILGRSGRVDGAAEEMRAIVLMMPDSAAAHNNLGMVLAEKGDLAGAKTAFEEAVTLAPDLGHPRFNLGRIHELQGDPAAAAVHYAEAARLDPRFADLAPAAPPAGGASGH